MTIEKKRHVLIPWFSQCLERAEETSFFIGEDYLFRSRDYELPDSSQQEKERSHIAVVVDEHGGAAGLATLEDLLETVLSPLSVAVAYWQNLQRPQPSKYHEDARKDDHIRGRSK